MSTSFPWTRVRAELNQPLVCIVKRGELKHGVCEVGEYLDNRFGRFAFQDVAGRRFGTPWISATVKAVAGKKGSGRRIARKAGKEEKKKAEKEERGMEGIQRGTEEERGMGGIQRGKEEKDGEENKTSGEVQIKGVVDKTKGREEKNKAGKEHEDDEGMNLREGMEEGHDDGEEGGRMAEELEQDGSADELKQLEGNDEMERDGEIEQDHRTKKTKLDHDSRIIHFDESAAAAATSTTTTPVDTSNRGRLYALAITPELWTRTLLHRTQIVYGVDASLIVYHLDLVPGKIVVESGTGSGSLSLSMARTVAPMGHVYTYDFNPGRTLAAKADFEMLGVSSIITARTCDAEAETGFEGVDGMCDAAFLDLPRPWLALKNCIKSLRTDTETRVCSFSPCMEQVQQTCEAMHQLGFFQIRTLECVSRDFETYRLQEKVPAMWEDHRTMNERKFSFEPSHRAGSTTVFPNMRTHTGYLTFCSRFPLLDAGKVEL